MATLPLNFGVLPPGDPWDQPPSPPVPGGTPSLLPNGAQAFLAATQQALANDQAARQQAAQSGGGGVVTDPTLLAQQQRQMNQSREDYEKGREALRTGASTAGTGGVSPFTPPAFQPPAAPLVHPDPYTAMEEQVLRNLQSIDPGTREEAEPTMSPWLALIPGYAGGFQRGLEYRRQGQALALQRKMQAGREAEQSFQRLKLIDELRQRQQTRQAGEQIAQLYGQGMDTTDPVVQGQILQSLARTGNLDLLQKMQDYFQQMGFRADITRASMGDVTPQTPPLAPGGQAPLPAAPTTPSPAGPQGAVNAMPQAPTPGPQQVSAVDAFMPVFRSLERSGNNAISPKGAVGHYQILPTTAMGYDRFKGMDERQVATLLLNPAINEATAREHISALINQYPGQPASVFAAYFAGPKAIAKDGTIKPEAMSWSDGNQTVAQYVQNGMQRLQAGTKPTTPPVTSGSSLAQTITADPRLQTELAGLEARRGQLTATLQRYNTLSGRIGGKEGERLDKLIDNTRQEIQLIETQIKNTRDRFAARLEPADRLLYSQFGVTRESALPEQVKWVDDTLQQRQIDQQKASAEATIAGQKQMARESPLQETWKDDATLFRDPQTGQPVDATLPSSQVYDMQHAGKVVKITKPQEERLNLIQEVLPIIQRINQYTQAIYGDGGILSRLSPTERASITSNAGAWSAFMQDNPTLVAAQRYLDANAEKVARAIGGVRGAGSEGDIERAKAGFARFQGQFNFNLWPPSIATYPDTRGVAIRLMNDYNDTLNGVTAQILRNANFQHPGLVNTPVAETVSGQTPGPQMPVSPAAATLGAAKTLLKGLTGDVLPEDLKTLSPQAIFALPRERLAPLAFPGMLQSLSPEQQQAFLLKHGPVPGFTPAAAAGAPSPSTPSSAPSPTPLPQPPLSSSPSPSATPASPPTPQLSSPPTSPSPPAPAPTPPSGRRGRVEAQAPPPPTATSTPEQDRAYREYYQRQGGGPGVPAPETPAPAPAPAPGAAAPQPGTPHPYVNNIQGPMPQLVADELAKAGVTPPAQPQRPQGTPANGFNTPLSAPEEAAFQQWKARYAPQDSGQDYDLRGAFLAGHKPDAVTGHWPDTYKKPNHPTFSTQSQYAQFGQPGTWQGETFVAPQLAGPAALVQQTIRGMAPEQIYALPVQTLSKVVDAGLMHSLAPAQQQAVLLRLGRPVPGFVPPGMPQGAVTR